MHRHLIYINLIDLTKMELTNRLLSDSNSDAKVIRKHIKYLNALCHNIENAEQRFRDLKEEGEKLDTLSIWSRQYWLGEGEENKEPLLAAMKLGIEIDELQTGGIDGK